MANTVFISYSHKDKKRKEEIQTFLEGFGESLKLDVWQDDRIPVGKKWRDEIRRAIQQTRVAVLLLTPNFLNSSFIRTEELYKFLQDEGVQVIPVLAEHCNWKSWESLKDKQVFPDADRALWGLKRAQRQAELKELVDQIGQLIQGEAAAGQSPRPVVQGQTPAADLEDLFKHTLCAGADEEYSPRMALALVDFLRDQAALPERDLLSASRYIIELVLLTAAEPYCQLAPSGKILFPRGDCDIQTALQEQKNREKDKRFASPVVGLSPGDFLERTLERAKLWQAYFNRLKLLENPQLQPNELQTLTQIEITGTGGALAPQYLLAGLMSQFQDNWTDVIDSYVMVGSQATNLDRVKASQWICWLVWGPSIPLCTCEHWKPSSALQFGYGDENNSLPAYLPTPPEAMRTLMRDAAYGERRAIEVEKVKGRLTWGPFRFDSAGTFAQAQARLTRHHDGRANVIHTDGLLLNVETFKARPLRRDEPLYFTSYIWLMFWVAGRRNGQDDLPLRVNDDPLPKPTADVLANSDIVSDQLLWKDLMPVFVHANIFDPVVLKFQKGMLIENALHLLRQVFAARTAPLEFHLVCASDYSGCGCDIDYPPPAGESLTGLLQRRLEEIKDSEPELYKATSVPVPGKPIPPAFRAFLSACHLPEMMERYYEFLLKRRGK
jgi:hypothetical protein